MRTEELSTSCDGEEIEREIRVKRDTIERLRCCTDNGSIGAECFVEQLRDLRELHGLHTKTLVSANSDRLNDQKKKQREG